ncbi:MAG: kinase anchor protein [Candidatus Nanohaloarchaea archaeon]|nr:kinase anchor protein [Candidatus Nanohaloarchaea archaeon]
MQEPEAYEAAENEALAEYKEPHKAIGEYLEEIDEHPSNASQAAKYILEAIEYEGTRTVIEEGEEKERYKFFDDPNNDGEHAILGNTETLNDFVDDLRNIAAGRGKDEKIVWIDGPTATGKSEMKRCLINGLNEYSKTDEGSRYTLEWNLTGLGQSDSRGIAYGDEGGNIDETAWYESPIQDEPLKLFSEDGGRQAILDDLNEQTDDNIDIMIEGDMDPFSRQAYDILEDHYLDQLDEDEVSEELFSLISHDNNVRVKRYLMDKGQGIGVLHAEDDGRPQQKLVGDWMRGMFQELDSQGAKDPRAHSYDGVVSQGHRGATIIEDAIQHADTVKKLLNVPEEGSVKLDKAIEMNVDTLFMMISNPDLAANVLEKNQQAGEKDPMRALRRRMEKHEFKYLTNYSLENDLIRRELTNETGVWERSDDYGELEDHIESALRLNVRDQEMEEHTKEYAPHAIEAASLYNVISRLDDTLELSDDAEVDESELDHKNFDLIDKALLYDKGELERNGVRIPMDDFEIDEDAEEGESGIPVTYTRDQLAELLQRENEYSHEELDVENVIMPQHVIEEMNESLKDAPLFSDESQQGPSEVEQYEGLADDVEGYIEWKQEQDVIQAIMADKETDEDTIEKYVRNVQADLADRDTVEIDGRELSVDHAFLKSFETKTLGMFDTDDYKRDNQPSDDVEEFRKQKIDSWISNQALQQGGSEYSVDLDELDLREIPVIDSLLGSFTWDDVTRFYENLDPGDWNEPKLDTETEEVKERAIDEMVDMGYSEASAEVTSRMVMDRVSDEHSSLFEGEA